MAQIKQWFVWRMTWDAAEGKFQKVPVYADGNMRRTGEGANNPAYWIDIDSAAVASATLTAATGLQHTIGFWLSKQTGYFFLDVDKCFADATSNVSPQHAVDLYLSLPGAFYERSSSGTGFHIIGRGAVPEHGSRNKDFGLELYTDGRGIAFNPSYVSAGCADVDCSGASLNAWVSHYFPPTATSSGDGPVMRDGPREDWRGPADDDELLRRAMMSTSTAARFNTAKAVFADLFTRDVAKLQLAYPDPNSPVGYGESEADAALASHFAFWTGCDVERMERLMRRSALARPKWNERRPVGTWLTHTCISAATGHGDVLKDKPVEPLQLISDTAKAVDPEAANVEGETYLNADAQKILFKGCVYVTDAKAIFVPREGGFTMMDNSQFNVRFGGYGFIMDNENGRCKDDAWEAFTKSRVLRHHKVDTTKFRPDLPAGSVASDKGTSFVNTYIPAIVPMKKGDPSQFLELVARMLPNERDRQILLAYMAAVVQYRGVKFKWCPVLQGTQGNGKSTIGDVLMYAVGKQHCYIPKSDELGDKFNDWLYEKVLIVVNDVYTPDGKDSFVETLKPMITDSWLQIQGKQAKKVMRDVCANFIMSMNRRDGIRADQNERRFAIFYTAQQCAEDKERDGLDPAFFQHLYRWLDNGGYEICAQWLHDYPIPEYFNPATWLKVAPETSTMAEAIVESRGPLEEAVMEAVAAGQPGFRSGWISLYRLKILAEHASGRKPKPSTLTQIMGKLGYVLHDSMNVNGYTNNPLQFDNGERTKLFVQKGHPSLGIGLTNADAAKLYESDQRSIIYGVA